MNKRVCQFHFFLALNFLAIISYSKIPFDIKHLYKHFAELATEFKINVPSKNVTVLY